MKKPSGKAALSLAMAATMFLSACGSSEPQTQPVTQEPVTQEEPAAIENPELETDKIVSVLVELSSYSMDVLNDYMSNVGKTYTIEDLLEKAKEEISATYDYLDGLENLPDQEKSEPYVTAAKDVINCVGASWIKARDYLENFKDEDLQTLGSIVSGYPFTLLQFSTSRYAYLSDAGYTEEEANEIIGSYGFSIKETETNSPAEQEFEKTNETSADWSTEQKNAMATAKSYLNYSAFSHAGLVHQLEYEKYPNDVAVWAADNCNADWNEEALEAAISYVDYSGFSYNGLLHQLEYEGFTAEQAKYGADNCNADWTAEAVECAKGYLESSAFSKEGLIDQLEYEGFTYEQALYAVEQNGF